MMLQEFAHCYTVTASTLKQCLIISVIKAGRSEDFNLFILTLLYRCLAHIINLATQAVISTCSKAKYSSEDPEENTIPENVGTGD